MMVHALWIAPLLIVLNALFVLMEYALVKTRPSLLEVLARRGHAKALRVQDMQKRLDRYLAAVQIGMTLIAIALGWIAQPGLAALISRAIGHNPWRPIGPEVLVAVSFAAALVVLTTLHVLFGELLPRGIAIQKPEPIALWGAGPLKLFADLFRWPVSLLSFCSVGILKLLGFSSAAENEAVLGEEEMRILLYKTQERGLLSLDRLFLIENLLGLSAERVSDAMTPGTSVAFLSLEKSWAENSALIKERRYSRYPLCEKDLDSAVGIIHIKDVFLGPSAPEPDLKALKRDLTSVLDSDKLDRLLKNFPDKGVHMAIVKNPRGAVVGLITLEDIVEELIGEVRDEFDKARPWSLADSLSLSGVLAPLEAQDRRSVIAALSKSVAAAKPELDARKIFDVVWEREMKFSSGLGRGVAFPHARLAEIKSPVIAVARLAKPVFFPRPDHSAVRLVFLILTPASAPMIQLRVLSRLAGLLSNESLRKKLINSKTAEGLFEALCAADTLTAD